MSLAGRAPAVFADGHSGLQLVMFDSPYCEFCEAWNQEVGVVYAKTDEGRRAPLVRAAISAPLRPEWTLREPVRYTPTFVLLRGGSEHARITGYPGESHFWGLLGAALRAATDDAL